MSFVYPRPDKNYSESLELNLVPISEIKKDERIKLDENNFLIIDNGNTINKITHGVYKQQDESNGSNDR